MKLYDCLVALRGDRGNSVPLTGVTVAEIAVLREIHGGSGSTDAVSEITETLRQNADTGETKPAETAWGNRTERNRLAKKYPKKIGRGTIVDVLWPGTGTPVAERLDELNLPDEAFKATARAIPAEVLAQREEEAAAVEPPKRRRKKAEAAEEPASADGVLA